MSFPLWMLLGFALWTAALLVFAVGGYRFSRILTGRAGMASFPADAQHAGPPWYQRALRAHANCLETLPLFTVAVFALHASGVASTAIDTMSGITLVARFCQSVLHISTVQTDRVVSFRFAFFLVQLASIVAIVGVVVRMA